MSDNNQDINTDLLNKFIALAENTVNAQSITTERLMKDEKSIKEINSILLGDGRTPGLVEIVRDTKEDIKSLQEKTTDQDIRHIKKTQDKIETQNKVLMTLGVSILITLIINILKVVLM